MSGFSKDDDRGTFRGLFLLGFILPLDAPLQLQNHRTCGINNLDVVALCELIGLGGLSMGSQQHLGVVQAGHVFVTDGNKSHVLQPLTLHGIMHNVAKTVERGAFGKLFLGFLDGGGDAEAETRTAVYLYGNGIPAFLAFLRKW